MRHRRGCWPSIVVLVLGVCAATTASAEDADRLRAAKALVLDRKYAEARSAWSAIQAAGGAEAAAALYWIARCSEGLGENERALGEYGRYLEQRPSDRTLAEEAKTSRVSLAVRLYKTGNKRHVDVAQQALKDANRTVRYFAALQVASLGPSACAPAVPVLKTVVVEEEDSDLVDRARLGLLRCDARALEDLERTPRGGPRAPAADATRSARGPRDAPAPSDRPPRAGGQAGWLKLRIYKTGSAEPTVSINVPLGLADLAIRSLPDDARQELRRKGYDPDNIWEKLRRLGPTQILEIVGSDGERIKLWIE